MLAGFYKQSLSFAFAPAFMREARIRIAAQWQREDLLTVAALAHGGQLSLSGLITHTEPPAKADAAYQTAFGDANCLLFSDIPKRLITHPESWHSLGFIAILAILGTAVSTLVFYHLVQITDAIRSSSVTYLMPIVACLWGVLRTDTETITSLQLGGMLVILIGVYTVNYKKNKQ